MNKGILKKAIKIYGEESQIDMMIEEMSELTKALCKWKRYDRSPGYGIGVRDELADVKIMLAQMEIIFGNLDANVNAKVRRLEKRLAEEGGGDAVDGGLSHAKNDQS